MFDVENKNYKAMFALFPAERYLDFVKQNSLHSKLAALYSQVTLLFEFVAVTNRGNTKPIDLVEIQLAMEQQRQYWRVEEAAPQAIGRQTMPGETISDNEIEAKSYQIEEQTLSQKIVDRVIENVRH